MAEHGLHSNSSLNMLYLNMFRSTNHDKLTYTEPARRLGGTDDWVTQQALRPLTTFIRCKAPLPIFSHGSRLTPGRTFAPATTVGVLSPDLAVWDHKILSRSKFLPDDNARDLAWSSSYQHLATIPR